MITISEAARAGITRRFGCRLARAQRGRPVGISSPWGRAGVRAFDPLLAASAQAWIDGAGTAAR